MSTSPPTMEDIARRVGVHRATVSNVLNGRLKSARSDAARRAEKIRRVALEMGYRPSMAARATATGRTGFIGMIRSASMALSVHEPGFEMGLDEALHARELCLVRDMINGDGEQIPRIVRENSVDGLIINYAFGTPPQIRDLLERSQLPAVWVNCRRETNCVRPDDEGAASEATEFLLSHGHQRVALLEIPLHHKLRAQDVEPHYSKVDRRAGYEAAMRAAGLTPRVESLPMPLTEVEQKSGWLLKACVEFLRRPDRPTAILCDFNGRTLLHALEIARLSAPDDVSVIAFDIEAGADERTAVDRVLVPFRPMGQVAVDELCALIDGPGGPRRPILLPFEFHRTGTVGRPGSAD